MRTFLKIIACALVWMAAWLASAVAQELFFGHQLSFGQELTVFLPVMFAVQVDIILFPLSPR